MKIEFQLTGDDDLPPSVEVAAIPQRGDIVEYQHTAFEVTGIRWLVEKNAARIVVEIKKK